MSLCCGKEHALLHSARDDVWAMGANDHGQLGLPTHTDHAAGGSYTI